MRRLSVVAGFVGAIALPASIWMAIPGARASNEENAGALVMAGAFGFLLGWGLALLVWASVRGGLRVVAWVADGFRQDRAKGKRG